MADAPAYRDRPDAPVIYFDEVAANGILNGAVQIELCGRSIIPATDGHALQVEFVTTGRLRCSPAAARMLRQALDGALAMLDQPHEPAPTGAIN